MDTYHLFTEFIFSDRKIILGSIGGLLGFAGNIHYYVNIFLRGGNKPSLFTWVPLSLVVGFGFYAQIKTGGLWGSAVTGVTAFNVFIVAIISLFCEKQKPLWSDWVCFVGALIAIVWWRTSDGLIMPVVIVSLANIIAFYPTWRNGYKNPFKETLWMWFLNCIKFVFGIAAIKTYSITTLLFPLSIATIDGAFFFTIFFRRKYLQSKQRLSL
ncbi:MAG: hypothetical protein NT098_02260 [Candidatus Parcubacteria bacterium]|nr:hypothetical protein [Candidatus Parcubacteria bacterium]